MRQDLRGTEFSNADLDQLFDNILNDDVITDSFDLPALIPQSFDDQTIEAAYRLGRALFLCRVHAGAFRTLVARIAWNGEAGVEDRARFKDIRANFKQMRFCKANFDRDSGYPPLLHVVTAELGHLQDDFKNGRRVKARMQGIFTLALLSPPLFMSIRRKIENAAPATGRTVGRRIARETEELRSMLAAPHVTGAAFHDMRKILSRRVSLYDTIRVVRPSPTLDLVSRTLADLNGRMGALHDDLVIARVRGTNDYRRDAFAIPADLRARIVAFIDRCALSDSSASAASPGAATA